MPFRDFVRLSLGPAVLVIAIALASPGVKVQAEDAPGPAALMTLETAPLAGYEPAGACSVDSPRGFTGDQIRAMTRERLLQQLAAAEPGVEVQPLNGRGYNYRREANPMAEMALLRAEAEQQARR